VSGYGALSLALMVGGLGPVLVLAAAGRSFDRLVALELGGAVTVLFMLVFVQLSGESYELILPLVLAPLSLVGILVFTRLLKDSDR
jgi:multisubunit Na+/H+ antiporter MnhF subunit